MIYVFHLIKLDVSQSNVPFFGCAVASLAAYAAPSDLQNCIQGTSWTITRQATKQAAVPGRLVCTLTVMY